MNTNYSEQVLKMAEVLDMRNAEDIVIINISNASIIADYFIICTGKASNHVRLLSDELEQSMGKEQVQCTRIEGYQDGRWIAMDFSDIIVHIFHKDERDFYDIERLWKSDNNWTNYPIK